MTRVVASSLSDGAIGDRPDHRVREPPLQDRRFEACRREQLAEGLGCDERRIESDDPLSHGESPAAERLGVEVSDDDHSPWLQDSIRLREDGLDVGQVMERIDRDDRVDAVSREGQSPDVTTDRRVIVRHRLGEHRLARVDDHGLPREGPTRPASPTAEVDDALDRARRPGEPRCQRCRIRPRNHQVVEGSDPIEVRHVVHECENGLVP